MDKRRGVPKISVEIFLSHAAEDFRRGAFLRFKKFWYRKLLELKEEVGNHDFSSKFFCLTVPKFS